mmetsp:Transcript_3919/g.4523  ORF Transcript_3919/g.4523 Transcript_3919/m.4523 type:complete len:257 (-) Transcript_3919:172-942(-)
MPKSYTPVRAWALCLSIFELFDVTELGLLYKATQRRKILRKYTNVNEGVNLAQCCGVLLLCLYFLPALNALHNRGSSKMLKSLSFGNAVMAASIWLALLYEMIPPFMIVFVFPCVAISFFLVIGGEDTPTLVSLLLIMALCSCFGLALTFVPQLSINILNEFLSDMEYELLKSKDQVKTIFILTQGCHGLALLFGIIRKDYDFIWGSAESSFVGFITCFGLSLIAQDSLFVKYFCLYLWYFFQMYLLWPAEKRHED